MSDPKRLVILKALTAHFETITPANGYVNDLSPKTAEERRVHRGKTVFSDDDPIPCVSILEALRPDDNPMQAGGGLHQKDSWPLLINGWGKHKASDLNPTDSAHYLMADVKRALGVLLKDDDGPRYMLGGVIEGLRVSPGVVRPPDESSERSYFYLPILVEVVERLDDPYAV